MAMFGAQLCVLLEQLAQPVPTRNWRQQRYTTRLETSCRHSPVCRGRQQTTPSTSRSSSTWAPLSFSRTSAHVAVLTNGWQTSMSGTGMTLMTRATTQASEILPMDSKGAAAVTSLMHT